MSSQPGGSASREGRPQRERPAARRLCCLLLAVRGATTPPPAQVLRRLGPVPGRQGAWAAAKHGRALHGCLAGLAAGQGRRVRADAAPAAGGGRAPRALLPPPHPAARPLCPPPPPRRTFTTGKSREGDAGRGGSLGGRRLGSRLSRSTMQGRGWGTWPIYSFPTHLAMTPGLIARWEGCVSRPAAVPLRSAPLPLLGTVSRASRHHGLGITTCRACSGRTITTGPMQACAVKRQRRGGRPVARPPPTSREHLFCATCRSAQGLPRAPGTSVMISDGDPCLRRTALPPTSATTLMERPPLHPHGCPSTLHACPVVRGCQVQGSEGCTELRLGGAAVICSGAAHHCRAGGAQPAGAAAPRLAAGAGFISQCNCNHAERSFELEQELCEQPACPDGWKAPLTPRCWRRPAQRRAVRLQAVPCPRPNSLPLRCAPFYATSASSVSEARRSRRQPAAVGNSCLFSRLGTPIAEL